MDAGIHVCTWIWRLEVNLKCLSLTFFTIFKHLFICYVLCVCAQSTCEVSRQFMWVSSLLPSCGCQQWKLGCKPWQPFTTIFFEAVQLGGFQVSAHLYLHLLELQTYTFSGCWRLECSSPCLWADTSQTEPSPQHIPKWEDYSECDWTAP